MKIEQFRDALGKLFAESIDLPRQEILAELELQCDCLRDDINDIRIRPQPNDSDQKPTQNATQRDGDMMRYLMILLKRQTFLSQIR
jgi:hypothetical protein